MESKVCSKTGFMRLVSIDLREPPPKTMDFSLKDKQRIIQKNNKENIDTKEPKEEIQFHR